MASMHRVVREAGNPTFAREQISKILPEMCIIFKLFYNQAIWRCKDGGFSGAVFFFELEPWFPKTFLPKTAEGYERVKLCNAFIATSNNCYALVSWFDVIPNSFHKHWRTDVRD
jgi:hypothetical protein